MIDSGVVVVVVLSMLFLTMLWCAARINRTNWCERLDQTGHPIGHVVIDGRCVECGRHARTHR